MVDVVGVMSTLPGGERCIVEPTVYALVDRHGDPCTWNPIEWLLPEPQRQVLSFPEDPIPPSDPSLTDDGLGLAGPVTAYPVADSPWEEASVSALLSNPPLLFTRVTLKCKPIVGKGEGWILVGDDGSNSSIKVYTTAQAKPSDRITALSGAVHFENGRPVLYADSGPEPYFDQQAATGSVRIATYGTVAWLRTKPVAASGQPALAGKPLSTQRTRSFASFDAGPVSVEDMVVTAIFYDSGNIDYFYIQASTDGTWDANCHGGIKVVPQVQVPLELGNVVTITGDVKNDASDHECYVDARTIVCTGSRKLPNPLCTNTRSLTAAEAGAQEAIYASPTTPGSGICPLGMRVRVCGKQTWGNAQDPTVYYLDDGFGLTRTDNSQTRTGIKVVQAASGGRTTYAGSTATCYAVTGVLGTEACPDGGSPPAYVAVPVVRVPAPPAASGVKYVRYGYTGNGSSWTNAYGSIQDGINAASATTPKSEVWVAASSTAYAPITLADGVRVYGGFFGDETSRDQRDWATHETIIDGGGSGSVVSAGSTVSTVGGARLDGFTIRNGSHGVCLTNASPAIANNTIVDNSGAASGGGIYCNGGAPLIWSNTIQENSATGGWMASGLGGGLYFDGSSPVVADNTIVDNSASSIEGSGYGGGIYCAGAGQPVFSGNTITGNSATTGGGICCSNSDATISHNNVSGSVDGGGVYCEGDYDVELAGNSVSSNPDYGVYSHNCSAALTNNTISDNTGVGLKCDGTSSSPAISGNTVTNNALGGIVVDGVAEATIQNNVVESNSGRDEGAGIAIKDSAATITANTIKNNTASREGGAIMIDNSSVTIERNWIEGNCSSNTGETSHGGGIAIHYSEDVRIANNLFLRNHTDGSATLGGGAVHSRGSYPIIVNNTFVGNYVGTIDEYNVYSDAGYGGAVQVREESVVTLINNIFSSNLARRGNSVAATEDGTVDISFCDAYPDGETENYAAASGGQYDLGTSIRYLTPGFHDPANRLFWLDSNSSLRQTPSHGLNPATNNPVPTDDIGAHTRPGDAYTDMGAYESDPNNWP